MTRSLRVALMGALLVWSTPAGALMRITNDQGGRIGTYVDKYRDWRYEDQYVAIDGLCASACTIVLAAIKPERVCVTARARLGFHAAYDLDERGRPVTNIKATQMLYVIYPAPIRRWIDKHGGLKSKMIFLQGLTLRALYKPCSPNFENASAYAR